MDEHIINNIKSLAVEMINKARSGHTGIALSSAPILYTLYAKHINVEPKVSNWFNRDRFILSAGHGSALLYAVLYYAGYNLSIDDLRSFRNINSKTPGHPEVGITDGVDMSTGPLGQGIASAVGMALASKMMQESTIIPVMGKMDMDNALIDYKVYVLCGDGDLMEGVSYEACSLAGNLNLDNLIVLYDSNNVSLDGDTSNTFTENVIDRFKAMGWYTDLVRDGNDITSIDRAIIKAKTVGRPAFIEIKTIIGKDTKYEGTHDIHGKALSDEEVLELKSKLNIPNEPFYVDSEGISYFRKLINERSSYKSWQESYQSYERLFPLKAKLLFSNLNSVDVSSVNFDQEKDMSLRDLNHIIMQQLDKQVFNLVGGSADLRSSTKAYFDEKEDVKDDHYSGKNIWFGVREHAMGSILNGLALCNMRPFGSTFLTFSDYLKPAIRMSALMNIPVNYIFTHDSISIGEDGPTHEPIEQLSTLRMIPNLDVFRPADINELIGCWSTMLNKNNPSALVLSKDVKGKLYNSSRDISKGAYIIRKEVDRLDAVIISTGTDVYNAVEIANALFNEYRIDIRVISMPSMELFDKQSKEYKDSLLPIGVKVIVIEAGSSMPWYKYVYNKNYLITLDSFGLSGHSKDVLEAFNFDYDSIKEKVYKMLR
ncbi:MAG: transketolase [Bacilli bacterium]|nr:transketolase [Bacilli bacterium]